MADRPLVRLFWRVLDRLDYRLTQARLRLADAVCGPEPEMPANRRRQHGRTNKRRSDLFLTLRPF
jgi:hypothetical protein